MSVGSMKRERCPVMFSCVASNEPSIEAVPLKERPGNERKKKSRGKCSVFRKPVDWSGLKSQAKAQVPWLNEKRASEIFREEPMVQFRVKGWLSSSGWLNKEAWNSSTVSVVVLSSKLQEPEREPFHASFQ